jgi:hypothetical protein
MTRSLSPDGTLAGPGDPGARALEQEDVRHLTPLQLAVRWSMSPRSLERWRREETGPPYIALPRRTLYRLVDIEAFEAAHKQPGQKNTTDGDA